MIKYLGSKRLLLPQLVAIAEALPDTQRVLDLFSGTARVGHALKAAGFDVVSNDHLAYAATLARCYVQADAARWKGEAERWIAELMSLPPAPGYFTETFCERARYFQPKNGARVDAMRDAIAEADLHADLEAILLVSLMEAADRVDSTTGVQMAYLKQWAKRAHNDIALRLPKILPGEGKALRLDALEAAATTPVDMVYLDPPYNQHRYIGNYHVWETLVLWDAPETYGVAQKRVPAKQVKSPFNSKRRARDAFAEVVAAARATALVVSFNDEGYLSEDDLREILATRGHVAQVAVNYKRYVGAQIGIHNPSGEKVGKVSHLRNHEWIYIVHPEPEVAERAASAARALTPEPR